MRIRHTYPPSPRSLSLSCSFSTVKRRDFTVDAHLFAFLVHLFRSLSGISQSSRLRREIPIDPVVTIHPTIVLDLFLPSPHVRSFVSVRIAQESLGPVARFRLSLLAWILVDSSARRTILSCRFDGVRPISKLEISISSFFLYKPD